MSAGAMTAGSIEYILGLDDTALIRGLQNVPNLISRQAAASTQAGQRLGQQMGGALVTASAAALQQQLQNALKQRINQAANGLPDIVLGSDTTAVDRGLADVKTRLAALSGQTIGLDVDAATAQQQISELMADLRQVAALSPDVQVRASAEQAIRQLEQVRSATTGLPDGTVRVDADTSSAERALRDLGETPAAGAAGGEISGSISEEMSSGLEKLTSKAGPLVGSILGLVNIVAGIGVGALLWKAIENGFEQESRNGLFKAQTGLDAVTVGRFARAAGESYAQNFGESVADNLETARAALTGGLLGGQATQREITDVSNKLSTVAQILGEEVPAVARAAGQAVKTGLARDATDALDLITKAQQNGLNVSEDLLDTITEYGTQFRKVGLDGPTAFGLIQQAVRNGARDVDLAADAIKEFSIRAIDGSEGTSASFESLGLTARDMQDRIAAGGASASSALQEIFDRIAAVKDPAERSAIAVGLFGTQAEDLGGALNSFDLSAARAEFGDTAGAIDQAMADIGNNAAGQVETAKRNIQTVVDNLSASIAAALGPEIGKAADWVTSNREVVTRYLVDVGHGMIDFVRLVAVQTANGLDALGHFAPVLKDLGTTFIATSITVAQAWKALPFTDNDEADKTIGNLRSLGSSFQDSMDTVGTAAFEGAQGIRTTVIPAVDDAQARFDAIAIPAVAQAAFSDATTRLGQGLDAVSAQAATTQGTIDRMTGSVNISTDAGKTLDTQLRTVAVAMLQQADTGAKLGQSQQELSGRYNEGRDALIGQLEQMGLTRDSAEKLAAQYGLVPGRVDTIVSDADTAAGVRRTVQALNDEIAKVKDRTVTITANLSLGSSAGKNSNGWSGGSAMATGGTVHGPGTGTSDEVPTWLSNGEEVIKATSASKHRNLLKAINRDDPTVPRYATGGTVGDHLQVNMTDPGRFRQQAGATWDSAIATAQKSANAAAAKAVQDSGAYTGATGSGVERWRAVALQALGLTGSPAAWIQSLLRRMNQESGGNPRAINNWDSNAAQGQDMKSKGLMQVIGPTFRANALAPYNRDIYDPLSNILASIRYANRRYGSAPKGWDRKGGYDSGGLAKGVGMLPKYTPLPERVLSPQMTPTFERLVDLLEQRGADGLAGTGGGATVTVTHHNQLMDDAAIALLARQEALELAGYLGAVGV